MRPSEGRMATRHQQADPQFNVRLKAAFPQNYISSYNYVVKNKGKTVDGIHYMPDTYRMIYRFLDSVV